ncbi:MAG: sensor histidine kinase, partial [Candidatus Omnitrophica bacterium]|nr:sensor histidine kinase [Candidatus Omnitrophota bacterium]
NSIKYTPSGESIDVLVSHESDTNNLRVEVKDTGNGIPEEYIDKIFDKFARIESDKTKPGRGLGLTFCKMMIEAHGGKIWVESNPKKGSVFIFTLPCGK